MITYRLGIVLLSAVAIAGVALAQSDINHARDDLSMPTKPTPADSAEVIALHQEMDFNASPHRLYEALLDAKQFAEFSGRAAEIDRHPGGAFSLFNGHIIGRNIELVPDQRIVQAWRVVTWPEGVYSIVRFELASQGLKTHLVLDHAGFPEGLHDHLADGWNENYWSLLRKYLH